MSTMNEKVVPMTNEETKANETKKESLFTRMKNKVKHVNWKKVGIFALNFTEGAAAVGLGFALGSRYGKQKAGLITGEGTVTEAEEETDDETEELLNEEEA